MLANELCIEVPVSQPGRQAVVHGRRRLPRSSHVWENASRSGQSSIVTVRNLGSNNVIQTNFRSAFLSILCLHGTAAGVTKTWGANRGTILITPYKCFQRIHGRQSQVLTRTCGASVGHRTWLLRRRGKGRHEVNVAARGRHVHARRGKSRVREESSTSGNRRRGGERRTAAACFL